MSEFTKFNGKLVKIDDSEKKWLLFKTHPKFKPSLFDEGPIFALSEEASI